MTLLSIFEPAVFKILLRRQKAQAKTMLEGAREKLAMK